MRKAGKHDATEIDEMSSRVWSARYQALTKHFVPRRIDVTLKYGPQIARVPITQHDYDAPFPRATILLRKRFCSFAVSTLTTGS